MKAYALPGLPTQQVDASATVLELKNELHELEGK